MDMERLQEYTTNVENLYNNLRTFKHDYKNILLTLNHYIENKDIDSLEKYYKENGGEIEVYMKRGGDHHPHGLPDISPVVDFIRRHY